MFDVVDIDRNRDFHIQEWCESCFDILYFIQVSFYFSCIDEIQCKILENYSHCKLCGKLVYDKIDMYIHINIKICSDCYKISSGWIESTLTKQTIPIVYLPWWDQSY